MNYTCEKHGKLRMSQICPECVDELRAEIEQLRTVLTRIEWSDSDDEGDYCPVCGNRDSLGHLPDCALAAVLKEDRT